MMKKINVLAMLAAMTAFGVRAGDEVKDEKSAEETPAAVEGAEPAALDSVIKSDDAATTEEAVKKEDEAIKDGKDKDKKKHDDKKEEEKKEETPKE